MTVITEPELPLRERKKALTRRSLIDAAERLFEERGFDAVTVAEIADAANVSVKTLFVYFRSKEELAFADTWLIDAIVDSLANRTAGTSAADAVAQVLVDALERDPTGNGLEGFHRGFGESAALEAGLRRMWSDYEDQVTAELARESGRPATPADRLRAIQLVGIARLVTGPEARAAVAGHSPKEAAATVRAIVKDAAAMTSEVVE
jgi:AcrR family transcriptional regulator